MSSWEVNEIQKGGAVGSKVMGLVHKGHGGKAKHGWGDAWAQGRPSTMQKGKIMRGRCVGRWGNGTWG